MTNEGPPSSPLEPATLALIARHLATEEYTLAQVFQRYKITQEIYDQLIAPNEYFKKVLEEYTKEWHSPLSTHKRLAFFAGAALEEKLPVLAARMGDRSSALADAVATAKLFRELAGIAAPAPQLGAGSGQHFAIRIDFGSHKINLETRPTPEIITDENLLEPPDDSTKDRSI